MIGQGRQVKNICGLIEITWKIVVVSNFYKNLTNSVNLHRLLINHVILTDMSTKEGNQLWKLLVTVVWRGFYFT